MERGRVIRDGMGRAFSPSLSLGHVPGALPQAGMERALGPPVASDARRSFSTLQSLKSLQFLEAATPATVNSLETRNTCVPRNRRWGDTAARIAGRKPR